VGNALAGIPIDTGPALGLSAVMPRLLRAVGLVLSLILALGASACGVRQEAPPLGLTGAVGLSLTGMANGVTYRLRNAEIVITLPSNTETVLLNSENDPDNATLSATLAAGFYSAELQPGWALERQDPAQVVEASLRSPNPISFGFLPAARRASSMNSRLAADP
jgi:hypothetical protein